MADAIRLSGPLRGLTVTAIGAKGPGINSVHDILDCRLALVLHEAAPIFLRHGFVRIEHMSMYRPGAIIAGLGVPSQHGQALAIDIGLLKTTDRRTLNVQLHWQGKIGDPVCPAPGSSDDATRLRRLVCDLHQAGLFHHFLTPNYNKAHFNHFHADIDPRGGSPSLR